jgi:hypothetical protein
MTIILTYEIFFDEENGVQMPKMNTDILKAKIAFITSTILASFRTATISTYFPSVRVGSVSARSKEQNESSII